MMIRIAWIVCLLAGSAASASAQTNVRVTRDHTTIWTADFSTAAAVVPAGTILTVVRRSGDWYEVVVPTGGGGSGFIFKSNVDTNTTAESSSLRRGVKSPPAAPRAIGIVGVGQFGYVRFAAEQSFNAVLGGAGGGFFGGGAEVRLNNAFLNVSVERFEKTGQRILVVDGEVFKLAIPDTITLTPVAVSAGWRFVYQRATPYIGGGVGTILYREEASFVDPSEHVRSRYASYHLLGGVEFRDEWIASAFEVQYTRAPHTIGVGGASAAFQESNLGGLVARIKVLVGR